MITDITAQIKATADEKNAEFVSRLLPQIPPETILGCRTPALRSLAKTLPPEAPEVRAFLDTLPHTYFDENQLHAFIISRIRNCSACIAAVETFLPYIDNWATCDQLSPTVFRKEAASLLPHIEKWLQSAHPYTVRFAIGMLMQHFLDARFSPQYPAKIAAIETDAYYINMESAWYFATALAKQPDAILPYFTEKRLPDWVWRKAIQKCIESRRIPDETKQLLRKLRNQK